MKAKCAMNYEFQVFLNSLICKNMYANMGNLNKSMSKNLLIVGAGEFAEIAWQYFTHDSEYEVVGFDINPERVEEEKKLQKKLN